MEKSKKVSLIKRILTSLVLIPVVLGCLFSGKEAVELLALTIAALLSWEWAGMMPSRSNVFFALSYFLAAVVAILVAEAASEAVADARHLAVARSVDADRDGQRPK